jgi:hypothetical protein
MYIHQFTLPLTFKHILVNKLRHKLRDAQFLAIPEYREKLLSRLGIDTIYVTREVMVPQTPDTIIRYVERPKIKKEVRDVKVVKPSVATTENNMDFTGRSIDQDNIDYTMLVMK